MIKWETSYRRGNQTADGQEKKRTSCFKEKIQRCFKTLYRSCVVRYAGGGI